MMTRLTALTAIAVGVATVATAIPAQADARNASRQRCVAVTEEGVNAQFARFTNAWATLNPDTVTDLFASNGTLLPTVSNRYRTDRAAIRDYFVSFLGNRPSAVVADSRTVLGCNMAMRTGNWNVTLTNPQTGAQSVVGARFSFVYTWENGDWKIAHLHSSVLPPS